MFDQRLHCKRPEMIVNVEGEVSEVHMQTAEINRLTGVEYAFSTREVETRLI